MAYTLDIINNINIYTQDGFNADFTELGALMGITPFTAGGTTSYVIDGAVIITGTQFHNHVTERLIFTRQLTATNAPTTNPTHFHVSGENANYWAGLPGVFTHGTANPTGGVAGDIYIQRPTTGSNFVWRNEEGTWRRLDVTNADDQEILAGLSWTAGTGYYATRNNLWWNRDTSAGAATRGASFATSAGGRSWLNGGRMLGTITPTTKQGGGVAGRIYSFAPFDIVSGGTGQATQTGAVQGGASNNNPGQEYIWRLLAAEFQGSGLALNGGSVSVGNGIGGADIQLSRSNGGRGFWMQHQGGPNPVFNITSSTNYPTILNANLAGNVVDVAPWQNNINNRSGFCVQSSSLGSRVNINGGEVPMGNWPNNSGYTFVTQAIDTSGLTRLENDFKTATTVQGVVYVSDVGHAGAKNHSHFNTAFFDDSADINYTFRFNDVITGYTVENPAGGANGFAANGLASRQRNEILLATHSLPRDGSDHETGTENTGIWQKAIRNLTGVSGEDVFAVNIWSYEQEFLQLNENIRTQGAYRPVLNVNNDPFISRNRTAAAAISTVGYNITENEYTITAGTSSDIYDWTKYQKETETSYRNVPTVSTMPVAGSGTTLELGSSDLVIAGGLTGTTLFDTIASSTTTLTGDLTDITLAPTNFSITGAGVYTNGAWELSDAVTLAEGSTFNGWEIDSVEEISNFGDDLTIGENGLTFTLGATLNLPSSTTGTVVASNSAGTGLLDGITIAGTGNTLDIQSSNGAGVILEFPAGMTVTGNTIAFAGGTIAGSANVTISSPSIVSPTYVDQPNVLNITGLPTGPDANIQLWDVTANRQIKAPIRTWTANTESTRSLRSGIPDAIGTSVAPEIIAIRDAYPTDEIENLGTVANRFEMWVYGRTLRARRYVFEVTNDISRINVAANAIDSAGDPVAIASLMDGDSALDPTVQSAANVAAIAPQVTNLTGSELTTAGTGTIVLNAGIPTFTVGGGHSIANSTQYNATGAETNGALALMRNLPNYGQALYNRLGLNTDDTVNTFFDSGIYSALDTTGIEWDIINTPTNITVNVRANHYEFDGGQSIEVYTGVYQTADSAAQQLVAVEANEPYSSPQEKAADLVGRNSTTVTGTTNPTFISLTRPTAPTPLEVAAATTADLEIIAGVTVAGVEAGTEVPLDEASGSGGGGLTVEQLDERLGTTSDDDGDLTGTSVVGAVIAHNYGSQ